MLTRQHIGSTEFYAAQSSEAQFRIEAAAVLPEQFFSLPSLHTNRPEAALMRAVLEEALNCFQCQFQGDRENARRLGLEAETWFFNDDTSWPFAFVNICTILGINPDYIRRGLRQWKQTWPLKIQQRKRRTIGSRRPLKLAA